LYNTHHIHFDPEDEGSVHLRSVSNITSEPPWNPEINNLQLSALVRDGY
jgi:hypothetical protein